MDQNYVTRMRLDNNLSAYWIIAHPLLRILLGFIDLEGRIGCLGTKSSSKRITTFLSPRVVLLFVSDSLLTRLVNDHIAGTF